MPREIILMSDIDGLGVQGDVVKVADGYARNYLVPKKLAEPVTESARRRLEKLGAKREEDRASELAAAQTLAGQLANSSCTIPVKTGEEGKLFGSVSTGDIAKALEELGHTVDKNKIKLEKPIRELGVYNLPVKLHPTVTAKLKVWIVEE